MTGFLWELLRQTDWKHFFKKNGLGEIKWRKESGWREQPNDLVCVFAVHGEIAGGYRGPCGVGMYAAWKTDATGHPIVRGILEEETGAHFESFALPDCRCRVGLHWKCEIHKNWKG